MLVPHPLNDPTTFGSLSDLFVTSRKEGYVCPVYTCEYMLLMFGLLFKHVWLELCTVYVFDAAIWVACDCCKQLARSSFSTVQTEGEACVGDLVINLLLAIRMHKQTNDTILLV